MNAERCFLLLGLAGLLAGCVTPVDTGYVTPYDVYSTPVYNPSPAYYAVPAAGYSTTTIYDGYYPAYIGPRHPHYSHGHHRPPPPPKVHHGGHTGRNAVRGSSHVGGHAVRGGGHGGNGGGSRVRISSGSRMHTPVNRTQPLGSRTQPSANRTQPSGRKSTSGRTPPRRSNASARGHKR